MTTLVPAFLLGFVLGGLTGIGLAALCVAASRGRGSDQDGVLR